MERHARAVLPLVLLLLASGCSGFTYNDSVEGTVKLDGKPVANVVVQFMPEKGHKVPLSTGQTDEGGHYTLTCDNGHSGAVLGKYTVVIASVAPSGSTGLPGAGDSSKSDHKAEEKPVSRGPGVYSNPKTTPLHEEVTKDKHTYDLALSSSPGKAGK